MSDNDVMNICKGCGRRTPMTGSSESGVRRITHTALCKYCTDSPSYEELREDWKVKMKALNELPNMEGTRLESIKQLGTTYDKQVALAYVISWLKMCVAAPPITGQDKDSEAKGLPWAHVKLNRCEARPIIEWLEELYDLDVEGLSDER